MVVWMDVDPKMADRWMAGGSPSLPGDATVQDLILYEESLEADELGSSLLALFKHKPLLPGVLITEGGAYVGMIPRQRFYEYITSFPCSMDVFSRCSVGAMLEFFQQDILCIPGKTPILTASQLSLQRPSQRIYEPIVVEVDNDRGPCAQLLDVHQLLLAQSTIHERLARELQAAQDHLHYLNQDLETRVAQRTHQLQLANEQLRQEIQHRQELQEKLHQLAYFDPLTHLPNQALLREWLADCLERHRGQPTCCALLVLDCDHFRMVNESLGHALGDSLLLAISQRLQSHLSPQELLCRVGEDEFVVVCDQVRDPQTVLDLAKRLQTIWELPFRLGSQEVFMSASMGIVLSWGYERVADMLRDADTAMYAAKSQRRGSIQVFEGEMYARAKARLQMETDLRRGLDRGEFRVFYQPIIDLRTKQIAGFEALVRWQHPQRGLLPPGEFIGAAEDNGLIVPLGYWVLQEASRQWQQWRQDFGIPLRMSINLSVSQLLQADWLQHIKQILAGIPRQDLVFEITESIFLEHSQGLFDLIQALDAFEVQLCLDDFGTGYSCLSYLKRLPIGNLKIDRSFVVDMLANPHSAGIVQALIHLGETLGMTVTAEGIESAEQAVALQQMGCDYGQGYFFACPLSGAAAEALLAAQTRWQY